LGDDFILFRGDNWESAKLSMRLALLIVADDDEM